MKTSEPKPTKEEILKSKFKNSFLDLDYLELYLEAMQEYAEQFHKEKMKEELMPCDKCRHDGLQQYPDTCQDCGGKEFSPLQ